MGFKRRRKTGRSNNKNRKKAYTQYKRNMKGGKVADRSQSVDFIFFENNINPKSAYDQFIIYTNPAKYLNIFDENSYLIAAVEQQLKAYSQNKIVMPAYKYRMNINSNHARTQDELDAEKKMYTNKINKLNKKKQDIETFFKPDD